MEASMPKRTSFLAATVLVSSCLLTAVVIGQQQRASDAPVWVKARPIVSWEGSYSAITEREYHRIVDEGDLKAIWEHHADANAERDCYGQLVLPKIDFDRFMALAIFNGEGWNTRGMFLVEMADTPNDVQIRFDASTYQTASFSSELQPLEIEGEVTPEKVADAAVKRMEEQDREREANKHNDPNFTSAYGIFILPRTDKPIVLIENVQNILGAPPLWEEKHRLDAVE